VSSDDWSRVTEVGIGCDQTSIYVVMSRVFQEGQLAGWRDFTELARTLRSGETLKIERAL